MEITTLRVWGLGFRYQGELVSRLIMGVSGLLYGFWTYLLSAPDPPSKLHRISPCNLFVSLYYPDRNPADLP